MDLKCRVFSMEGNGHGTIEREASYWHITIEQRLCFLGYFSSKNRNWKVYKLENTGSYEFQNYCDLKKNCIVFCIVHCVCFNIVIKLFQTGFNNHIALTDPMKFEKDFEKELKHHFNCVSRDALKWTLLLCFYMHNTKFANEIFL